MGLLNDRQNEAVISQGLSLLLDLSEVSLDYI